MDSDYRQTIVHLELANQRVNQVTCPQDLALAEQKPQAPQKYLDALDARPAWFLDAAPQRDCIWVQCNRCWGRSRTIIATDRQGRSQCGQDRSSQDSIRRDTKVYNLT